MLETSPSKIPTTTNHVMKVKVDFTGSHAKAQSLPVGKAQASPNLNHGLRSKNSKSNSPGTNAALKYPNGTVMISQSSKSALL